LAWYINHNKKIAATISFHFEIPRPGMHFALWFVPAGILRLMVIPSGVTTSRVSPSRAAGKRNLFETTVIPSEGLRRRM
jgi:hypothetical protein